MCTITCLPSGERTIENLVKIPATEENYPVLKTAILQRLRTASTWKCLYRPTTLVWDSMLFRVGPPATKLLKYLSQMQAAEKTDQLIRDIFEASKNDVTEMESVERLQRMTGLWPLNEDETQRINWTQRQARDRVFAKSLMERSRIDPSNLEGYIRVSRLIKEMIDEDLDQAPPRAQKGERGRMQARSMSTVDNSIKQGKCKLTKISTSQIPKFQAKIEGKHA